MIRLLRRLTGPVGRRVLLMLVLAAAWSAWHILPPRPLREWTTESREPADWLLTPDRTRFACVTRRLLHDPEVRFVPAILEYGPVRLWDLATGRELLNAGGDQPTNIPVTVQSVPDGSGLLITRRRPGPAPAVLQSWDAATGRERWSITVASSPWGYDLPASVVVSPDGQLFGCRNSGGHGDIRDTGTGQSRLALGDAWPLAFAPDGQTVVSVNAVADADRPAIVTLWDTTSGRSIRQLTLKHRFPVAAAISPDGHWLAVALLEKVIEKVADLNSPADPIAPAVVELFDLRFGDRAAELDYHGRDAGLGDVRFSSDGLLLVVPSINGCQRIWDVSLSPPRPMLMRSGSPYLQVNETAYPIFAPDGTSLVEVVPRDVLFFRKSTSPDNPKGFARQNVQMFERPEFSADSRTLAVMHQTSFTDTWKQAINWIYQTVGRPWRFGADASNALSFFDTVTGSETGRIGNFALGSHLIGFGPTGRTVWTMTHIRNPPTEDPPATTGDGTLCVQEWTVPSPWPPLWLFVATALGVLLIVADWRRSRRRAVTIKA